MRPIGVGLMALRFATDSQLKNVSSGLRLSQPQDTESMHVDSVSNAQSQHLSIRIAGSCVLVST